MGTGVEAVAVGSEQLEHLLSYMLQAENGGKMGAEISRELADASKISTALRKWQSGFALV